MIFAPEERLKKKMQKDGSVLKYMYRTAGAKRGLIIGGLLLFLVGILLYAVPMGIDRTTALWLGVAMAVPGGRIDPGEEPVEQMARGLGGKNRAFQG